MVKKVLIATNPLNHHGGVVNYYRIFLKRFSSDEVELLHHVFGSRMEHYYSPWKKRLLYPLYYCLDWLRFFWRLMADRQIRIVQVSPSLIPVPLIRDAFIVLGARLLNRRTIVFFRGWKEDVVRNLRSKPFARWLFRVVYRRADVTLVLASRFKEDLVALGWTPSAVQVTTTMYEAEAVLPAMTRAGKRPRFLFLGRISQFKGTGELIEAAKIVAERGHDFEFAMVGSGNREGVVEKYAQRIAEYGLADRFTFPGRLTGREKYQAFADGDIFVFPSWTEGCPTSVLEALGAGLFVISTDVGALRDIVRERDNGRVVQRKDSGDLADKLVWACENIEEIRKRREQIQSDARDRYEVSVIMSQFNKVYARLIVS